MTGSAVAPAVTTCWTGASSSSSSRRTKPRALGLLAGLAGVSSSSSARPRRRRPRARPRRPRWARRRPRRRPRRARRAASVGRGGSRLRGGLLGRPPSSRRPSSPGRRGAGCGLGSRSWPSWRRPSSRRPSRRPSRPRSSWLARLRGRSALAARLRGGRPSSWPRLPSSSLAGRGAAGGGRGGHGTGGRRGVEGHGDALLLEGAQHGLHPLRRHLGAASASRSCALSTEPLVRPCGPAPAGPGG